MCLITIVAHICVSNYTLLNFEPALMTQLLYAIKEVVGVAINAAKTEVQWGKVVMPNQSTWLA